MQSAEIELKFPVGDLADLQGRLPSLGFHLETPRTFEHNALFDTPARDLRARHQVLRLRTYGDRCVLTHKRMPGPGDPADTTQYKVRIETETTIGDCEAMREVFRQMGYESVFIYEKFRTEWSSAVGGGPEHGHLVLDETPIGVWAELEGPVAWIDEMLGRLRVDPASCLTDSYGKLFLTWRERTGSLAEHLTFTEIGDPALSRG